MIARSNHTNAAQALIRCVRVYQYVLSPHFGAQCRFTPSCSHYAIDALNKYGAVQGTLLASRRLLRCHPWQDGGYDPVP
jgi:putative membrane protein insertion efficiency factor